MGARKRPQPVGFGRLPSTQASRPESVCHKRARGCSLQSKNVLYAKGSADFCATPDRTAKRQSCSDVFL